MPSRRGWTEVFLMADPMKTGVKRRETVARRTAWAISRDEMGSSFRKRSQRVSSASERCSMSSARFSTASAR